MNEMDAISQKTASHTQVMNIGVILIIPSSSTNMDQYITAIGTMRMQGTDAAKTSGRTMACACPASPGPPVPLHFVVLGLSLATPSANRQRPPHQPQRRLLPHSTRRMRIVQIGYTLAAIDQLQTMLSTLCPNVWQPVLNSTQTRGHSTRLLVDGVDAQAPWGDLALPHQQADTQRTK